MAFNIAGVRVIETVHLTKTDETTGQVVEEITITDGVKVSHIIHGVETLR